MRHNIPNTPDDCFLANMRVEFTALVTQAAGDTKFNIYIVSRTWLDDIINPRYVEVRTRERRNHSPFWDRFDELKRQQLKELVGVEL